VKFLRFILCVLCVLSWLSSGCESASRYNRTAHTVERWEVSTNSAGHTVRVLIFRERWTDANGLQFGALFTDPTVAGWSDISTNQSALGGGQAIRFGAASSKVDSEGIKAAGSAGGEVIGTAIKSAIK
jgi:hypothetical protein